MKNIKHTRTQKFFKSIIRNKTFKKALSHSIKQILRRQYQPFRTSVIQQIIEISICQFPDLLLNSGKKRIIRLRNIKICPWPDQIDAQRQHHYNSCPAEPPEFFILWVRASFPEKLPCQYYKKDKQSHKHTGWFCFSNQKNSQKKHSPARNPCLDCILCLPPVFHKKHQNHRKNEKCKLVRIIKRSHKPGTAPALMKIASASGNQNNCLKHQVDPAHPAKSPHKRIRIKCPERPDQECRINPIKRM